MRFDRLKDINDNTGIIAFWSLSQPEDYNSIGVLICTIFICETAILLGVEG